MLQSYQDRDGNLDEILNGDIMCEIDIHDDSGYYRHMGTGFVQGSKPFSLYQDSLHEILAKCNL